MTEAEKAYKAAEELIARVKGERDTRLNFDRSEFRTLERLPPFISQFTELETLNLNNTQISDSGLAHLSSLEKLRIIYLGNTQISDAGLVHLKGLGEMVELYLGNTQVSDVGLAHLSGLAELQMLSFNNTRISDAGLAHLAGLAKLQALYLASTQISEVGLAHLVGLVEIWAIALNNTQIGDMRVLLDFAAAKESVGERVLKRLDFLGIPALERDDRLRELSKIVGFGKRTAQTIAYLAEVKDHWPPLPKKPLTQDSILTVVQTEDGRLDIAPSHPAAEELTDVVKAKAHEKLKVAVSQLNQTAGNYHPRLARLARDLFEHIDCPLADMDMLDVHFELEALRGTFERRSERKGEDVFGDEVVDALDNVLLIGPGLVLDNEAVEKLEARKDRYRGTMPSADVQKAEDDLSGSIIDNTELFGDNMRGYSVTFVNSEIDDSPRLRAGQETLNKNTVIKVGTNIALFIAKNVGSTVVKVVTTAAIGWVVLHSETIMALASAWGEPFQAWITPIIMRAKETVAASKDLASKITKD